MTELGVYLYESAISIAVLYLFYWILLRKETLFSLNRTVLGASMGLALLVPIIKISFTANPEPGTMFYILDRYILEELVMIPEAQVSGLQSNISFSTVFWSIYILGVLFFTSKLIVQFVQVFRLIHKSGIRKLAGFKLVHIEKDLSPFSFFNLIFINTKYIPEHKLKNILLHEWEHIRRLHTIDIIILEIVCIFQWFNPFVWLYKHALKEVHEFEADRAVIRKGENKINYQKLILQQVFGNQFFHMVHNLIDHSLIKKRITMLTKRETKIKTLLKTIAILPVAMVLVVVFSFTKESVNEGNILNVPGFSNSEEPNFILPLALNEKIPVTAGYGFMIDPFTKLKRFHYGVDIKAKQGTPVIASSSGIVEEATIHDGYGKYVQIKHGEDYQTRYTHLNEINVKVGQMISQGQEIGTVGSTGKSTAPHLHFEIIKNGKKLDPMTLLSTHININQNTSMGGALASQDTVYEEVDQLPVFLGNESNDFNKFIIENLTYPESARKEKISGKVFVEFVISSEGKVSNVKVVRGIGPAPDAESLRVIKLSPDWKPAKVGNKNVAVKFTIPIIFNLNGDNTKNEDEPKIFHVAEEMPEFQGSKDLTLFKNWIVQNLRYPKEAIKEGIQGKVYVSLVIDEEGHLTEPKVIRGAHPLLDKEAIRVVSGSPQWKPGTQDGAPIKVSYTFPINFVLDGGKEKPGTLDNFSLTEDNFKNMLCFIDGKEASWEEVNACIETKEKVYVFSVLKPETGKEKYGERGKNGVVLIKTK